jgi:hypothetical protein
MGQEHEHKARSYVFAGFVIGATAFCALLPWFWYGTPSGHDFEFHLNSWIEVLGQWKEGVLYPHWSALAHFGYGEARFIFYPPASWTVGALLGAILPWKVVSGTYNWIALTLAGFSMLPLARRWLSKNDALFAAVFYAVNPYHLVIVYWRSAMAELLAATYIPLLLLWVLRLEEDASGAIAPLSLIIAAAWLTNIPSAVMIMYSVGLLSLFIAMSVRSWKILASVAVAIALGMGAAAVYLLPVVHQREWVSLPQVLSPGMRALENFLFTVTHDEDHNRFNRIVSVVALWEIVILVLSLWIARRRTQTRLLQAMVPWTATCTALMVNFTLPLWNHLPELQYVQFPWRWLLCLNVPVTLVVTLALRRWWLRLLVCAIAIGSVPYVWHSIQPPWWDQTADIQEMVDNHHDGIGNDGTDEYVPAGADPSDIGQNAPAAIYEGPGTAAITVREWQTEKRQLSVATTLAGRLKLRLFNYPLWRAEVNGRGVQTASSPDTVQMEIPIESGNNEVRITWSEGWDRKLGAFISALALVLIYLVRCYVTKRVLKRISPSSHEESSHRHLQSWETA